MGIIVKQTIKSSIYAYLGVALGFFTTSWLMPHSMTTEENGLVRLLWSITVLLVQFSNLGFNTAGIRYFPHFRDEKNSNNGFLFLSCMISLIGFVICMGLFSIYKPFIYKLLNAEPSGILEENLYSIIPLTLFTLYFNVFDNYAKSLYNATTGTFWKEFGQRIFIAISIIIFLLKLVNFQVFIILWQIAICLPTLVMIGKVWYDGNLNLKPQLNFLTPQLIRGIASLSALTFLSGFTTQIVKYIDQIQITAHKGLSENGIYATVMMFGSVISMPSQQLARISGTVIADAWRNNDLDNILKVYQKSCINQLLIGGLVFIGIIANLHNVFAILPPEYATGKWVIIIIGIGQIFDMFTGVNGIILSTSKYYYFDSIFMILLIFGTWQLNEALIPEYGITGSAIATALSILAFNSFRTFFVWYKFGMQPFSLHNLYILIIMAAVYFLSMLLPVVPGFAGIPGFLIDTPIRSALITSVFIFTVYTLKISPEINTLLDSSIKKILQLLKR